MIPEIDIWRAAQLMLKRYGEKAAEKKRRACRQARDRQRRGRLIPVAPKMIREQLEPLSPAARHQALAGGAM